MYGYGSAVFSGKMLEKGISIIKIGAEESGLESRHLTNELFFKWTFNPLSVKVILLIPSIFLLLCRNGSVLLDSRYNFNVKH